LNEYLVSRAGNVAPGKEYAIYGILKFILKTIGFMEAPRKMKQFKKLKFIIAGISATLLMLSGCGSTPVSNSSTANQASENTANSSKPLGSTQSSATSNEILTKGTTNFQSTQTSPLFQTTLALPNGKVVTPNHSVRWEDLSIQLLVTSLPPSLVEGYKAVVGNHSTVISHETIPTSAREATLVLNERTPPAASQSSKTTYEYWVVAYGSQYAYAIDAIIVGSQSNAKSEVMELLNHWKVPKRSE
jgi:hypothetical protein